MSGGEVWGVVEDEGIIVFEELYSDEPEARVALLRWMARHDVQLEQVEFELVGDALTCRVRRS